jgi:hypothetical protein
MVMRMRRFGKRARDDHDAGLGDACEALLHGSYVEHLERRQDRVPAWAWLNRLAHGTPDELRHLASWDDRRPGNARAPVWRAAQNFLAAVVLDRATAEGSGGLAALQQRSLVPLELALIAAPDAAITPAQLVSRVLALLDDHRSRSH